MLLIALTLAIVVITSVLLGEALGGRGAARGLGLSSAPPSTPGDSLPSLSSPSAAMDTAALQVQQQHQVQQQQQIQQQIVAAGGAAVSSGVVGGGAMSMMTGNSDGSGINPALPGGVVGSTPPIEAGSNAPALPSSLPGGASSSPSFPPSPPPAPPPQCLSASDLPGAPSAIAVVDQVWPVNVWGDVWCEWCG